MQEWVKVFIIEVVLDSIVDQLLVIIVTRHITNVHMLGSGSLIVAMPTLLITLHVEVLCNISRSHEAFIIITCNLYRYDVRHVCISSMEYS